MVTPPLELGRVNEETLETPVLLMVRKNSEHSHAGMFRSVVGVFAGEKASFNWVQKVLSAENTLSIRER